ncbi:hypothetical protein [Allokutzneria albata]|uniref:Small secreted domain n=1 Tax=Allokutzneria albata TaxID=211114 RepID=A0A1G9SLR5_ALLAB|nr:hypothetical protein [Allokutzneria albata]SDM36424.1 hypothetical protein SAMN04489726_1259 [Allokutzneria albata]
MLKKTGFVAATAAAGLLALAGAASATPGGDSTTRDTHGEREGQVGLVNLNNTDVLHNVNGTLGFCDNDVNVLGIQVPLRNVANGIGVPILSPGENEADNEHPYNCASGVLKNGGSAQHSG